MLFELYYISFCFISKRLKIYELIRPRPKIRPNELMSLKLVQASSKNENTVVAQEINTAEFVCIEF